MAFGIDDALMIGGSLLSGIFGSKKKKEETTINYVKMAQNAEAAGFNPLTALRNGGSAGFTTTVSHPGLSAMGDAISAIGGQLGTKLNQKVDPIAAKRNKVEDMLLDYQLAALQSQKKPAFGAVPRLPGNSKHVQKSPGLSTKRAPDYPPSGIVAGDAPKASSIGLEDRLGWHVDPGTADAEAWEQRYAEPGEWVGGLYVMGADAYHNAKRKLSEWHKLTGSIGEFGGDDYWKTLSSRKRGRPSITAHQADPGSWLDFAPRIGR